MNTVYHLNSALEITPQLFESIKAAYQNRPITITVEDSTYETDLTPEQQAILENRLAEPESHYISAEKSIDYLRKKYGV